MRVLTIFSFFLSIFNKHAHAMNRKRKKSSCLLYYANDIHSYIEIIYVSLLVNFGGFYADFACFFRIKKWSKVKNETKTKIALKSWIKIMSLLFKRGWHFQYWVPHITRLCTNTNSIRRTLLALISSRNDTKKTTKPIRIFFCCIRFFSLSFCCYIIIFKVILRWCWKILTNKIIIICLIFVSYMRQHLRPVLFFTTLSSLFIFIYLCVIADFVWWKWVCGLWHYETVGPFYIFTIMCASFKIVRWGKKLLLCSALGTVSEQLKLGTAKRRNIYQIIWFGLFIPSMCIAICK